MYFLCESLAACLRVPAALCSILADANRSAAPVVISAPQILDFIPVKVSSESLGLIYLVQEHKT